MEDLELKLKTLIVNSLKLEDIAPEQIDSDEPLFGDEGLALDSIDALELGVALRKAFDLQVQTVTEEIRRHFYSVKSLAAFIRAETGRPA
jgi:acyl carrier protein